MSEFKKGDIVRASGKLLAYTRAQSHPWCLSYNYSLNELKELKFKVLKNMDSGAVRVKVMDKRQNNEWTFNDFHLELDGPPKTKQDLIIDKIKYLDTLYRNKQHVKA